MRYGNAEIEQTAISNNRLKVEAHKQKKIKKWPTDVGSKICVLLLQK